MIDEAFLVEVGDLGRVLLPGRDSQGEGPGERLSMSNGKRIVSFLHTTEDRGRRK